MSTGIITFENFGVSIKLYLRPSESIPGSGNECFFLPKTCTRKCIAASFKLAANWNSSNVPQWWNIKIRIYLPNEIFLNNEKPQITVISDDADESHRENME